MWPILFKVPGLGLEIHSFSLTLVAATFAAVYLSAWRASREGIKTEVVFDLAVWLLTGGFLGARAMFLALHPEVVHTFWDVFKVWQGGIVFYGCIIGGLIGSLLYWARHPFPFLAMCDAVAPALGVGIAIGRLGCLLNGCCFGSVSRVPWAITFPAGSMPWIHHVSSGWLAADAPHSLPVHPAQIYAILDGLVLLALLSAYFPHRRRDGQVMALLMMTYPITRFVIEGLRDDDVPFLAGLTVAQCISLVLFPCGLATWFILARKPAGTYAQSVKGAPRADQLAPLTGSLAARGPNGRVPARS